MAAAPWKLYIACWFLGASVQSAVFFSFNAVDYFNYFFPDDYKPEVYIGVTVGVGASLGAVLTVCFPPRRRSLSVLMITMIVSALILILEVVVTPLKSVKDATRFGILLGLVFLATVIQNVGGGALYNFVGKHFPSFGVHAAQSGGVCAFAATFIVRCISKGSFEHEANVRRGFQLSGYLFVVLVDLIILAAACFVPLLRPYEKKRTVNVEEDDLRGETQPLLRSDEHVLHARGTIMKSNIFALLTICFTLVISNALFPGITSQFHGKYNCNSSDIHSSDSQLQKAAPSPTPQGSNDKTGWFVVILFGCYSVADAVGKNLPIIRIIYNKKTILINLAVQLVVAIPILCIYFEPCVTQLQADWVAYVTVGLLGLINGYGICAAMMLLAPGEQGKKHEEGMATSIGYMFLQVGILVGMAISVFLVEYVFKIAKH